MSVDLAAAFVLFAVVTLFTPGPNNFMLMASGLNFGMAATRAHMLGVALGFCFMVLLVGIGLGAVFEAYPPLYTVINLVGAAYLLFLAWRIARSGTVKEGRRRGRPMNFLEAVAFQWVNPKAWVTAVGAVSAYAAVTAYPWNIIFMASVFGVLTIASSITWISFGSGMGTLLSAPRTVRVFNIVMALALVASLVPVFAGLFQ